jgi:diaminopimelate decarboxylase
VDLVTEIVRRCFRVRNGELCIGELPVSNIVDKFGTPAFIYSQDVLQASLNSLREAIPAFFSISYSVKANPTQEILRFFLERDCGLEVASGGELVQALAAGCPAQRIIFAGPGKTISELELAVQHDIKEIHLESRLEIERVSELCRRQKRQARVAIRVNPNADAQGGAMRMGGKPAPFGIDEECLAPEIARVLKDPFLVFRGIHLFTGTQILDHAVLITQYRKALEIGHSIAAEFACPIQTIDFGGGLGIPYFPGDRALDLAKFRSGLESLRSEIENDQAFAGTEFMIEPGRFLVGESGIYVARINDIKVSRGKKFLVLDGGMNHHLAASGNLGQTIKRNYPVALLNKMSEPAKETVEVVGPLCTPLDVLARNVSLPEAEVGDLFGVFQSGAYGRSASVLEFLSHAAPPEVLVKGKSACLIRKAGESPQNLLDRCRAASVTPAE